jgi:chromosome segregation ATPase
LEEDLKLKRNTFVAYLNELSRMKVDVPSVALILGELKENNVKTPTSITVEKLSPEVLREFMSLDRGYNLLAPRQKYLALEVDRLKAEIDSLENIFTDEILELSLMQEKLATAEQSYQALLIQYRDTKSQINTLKLTINKLRPQVEYQEKERDVLEMKTKDLAAKVANLELERNRLSQNIIVYTSTFDKFAGLLENARVAKANQPSDVKIVARAVEVAGLPFKFLTTVFVFGMIGGFGALFLAFFLEYVEKARSQMDETARL